MVVDSDTDQERAVRTVNYAPDEVLRWLYRHGGSVVRLPTVLSPVTDLIGSEANASVFAHDELFRCQEAFKALVLVGGPSQLGAHLVL